MAIIHFGMDKTGSTSIRVSLSKKLSDPRFHYVMLGLPNASRALAAAFKENPETYPYFRHSGLSAEELMKQKTEAIKQLDAQLRQSEGKTAILSAEAVSSFKEPELRGLCDAIGRHGRETMAVGYIRRPKEYMESNLQQQINGHFVAELRPERLLSDYRARFERFDNVLGRNRVQLWRFDPTAFPAGCVVQDFCRRLGIAFRPEDVIRINDGLSLPSLSLLFAYRVHGPAQKPSATLTRENGLLVQRLRKLAGPKLRLHSSLVIPVLRKRRASIAWIEERLDASLAEDLAAHDETAIRSEADLLKFTPDSLKWLATELGPDYERRWRPRMTPQEVAEWMHLLRMKLTNADHFASTTARDAAGSKLANVPVKMDRLVQQIRKSDPALRDLSDEDARTLLLEAFQRINWAISAAHDVVINVEGLGQFCVRSETKVVNGREVTVRCNEYRPARTRMISGENDQ